MLLSRRDSAGVRRNDWIRRNFRFPSGFVLPQEIRAFMKTSPLGGLVCADSARAVIRWIDGSVDIPPVFDIGGRLNLRDPIREVLLESCRRVVDHLQDTF